VSGGITGYRAAGQGNLRRRGGGDMADGEVFTDGTERGGVGGADTHHTTGILDDLVLPIGAFDPGRTDEIRELAA
jgi:hypothetical protein